MSLNVVESLVLRWDGCAFFFFSVRSCSVFFYVLRHKYTVVKTRDINHQTILLGISIVSYSFILHYISMARDWP